MMKSKKNIFHLPDGVTGPFTEKLKEASALAKTDPKQGCSALIDVILLPVSTAPPPIESSEDPSSIDAPILPQEDPWLVKEVATYTLGKTLLENRMLQETQQALVTLRPFFAVVSKVRTAKIVRHYIDLLSDVPGAEAIQESLCLDTISWAKTEKRTFLRHRVETRLAYLYYKLGRYKEAQEIIDTLLKELKKLEDKLLLVEIHYIEARVNLACKHLPRAKTAYTTSRNISNATHCPSILQANIDMLAGEIQLEEKDPKTSFAYFVEAFDAYNAAGKSAEALKALTYAMLSKIVSDAPDDIGHMILQKKYLPYSGKQTDGLIQIAKCYKERDLQKLRNTVDALSAEQRLDPLILGYARKLFEFVLEQNLLKVLKPYSKVEIAHVAEQVNHPADLVENKLSQMILNKQLDGSLNQSSGILRLYETESIPSAFTDSLEIYQNLAGVVDILHKKAQTAL